MKKDVLKHKILAMTLLLSLILSLLSGLSAAFAEDGTDNVDTSQTEAVNATESAESVATTEGTIETEGTTESAESTATTEGTIETEGATESVEGTTEAESSEDVTEAESATESSEDVTETESETESMVGEPISYTGEKLFSVLHNGTHTEVGEAECDVLGKVAALTLNQTSNDPSAVFVPDIEISEDEYKYIAITVKASKDITYKCNFFIYTNTGTSPKYDGEHLTHSSYALSGAWQTLFFDMSKLPDWGGTLESLRLDYFQGGNEYSKGECAYIYDITLLKSEEGLDGVVDRIAQRVHETALDRASPVAVFDGFSAEELDYFGKRALNQTTVSLIGDDIKFTAGDVGSIPDPYVDFDYLGYVTRRGEIRLQAEQVSHIYLRYKMNALVFNPSAEIFYYAGEQIKAEADRELPFECHNNGNWCASGVMVAGKDAWSGAINGIRIDWCANTLAGGEMVIDSIIFFYGEESAGAYADTMNSYIGTSHIDPSDIPVVPPVTPPEDSTETEPEIDDPFEEETESELESESKSEDEELPTFSDDTEQSEQETESVENVTDIEESGTENDTGNGTGGGVENESEDNTDEPEPAEKSKMPFYVATISMSALTLVSILLIAVLKIKDIIALH